MSKQICVEAGKVAGKVVRTTAGATQKACGGLASVGKSINPMVKSICDSTKNLCSKLGHLFSRVRKDSRLAVLEVRQKDVFQKIGQEVFSLLDSGKKDILENESAKDLLKEAGNYEKEMQKVKDEISLRMQKMEEREIFNRAKTELRDPDPRKRRIAIRILERIGTTEVLPILSECLRDSDNEVKSRAAITIEKIVGNLKKKAAVSKESTTVTEKSSQSEQGAK